MSTGTALLPIIMRDLNLPWESVTSVGVPISFKAGSIVSGRNSISKASGLFFIKQGRIKLSHISLDGQEKVLFYLGGGMLFNEIPMLLLFNDYIFTCVEPVYAVFWSKRQITSDFVRRYPELMLNMLESVSRKAQNFYTQLCGLQSFDSFVNVCRALCSMERYNKEKGKIIPYLSKQELAAFLGTHRSTLHKALSRLKKEDIIDSYCKRELRILDLQQLRNYAGL